MKLPPASKPSHPAARVSPARATKPPTPSKAAAPVPALAVQATSESSFQAAPPAQANAVRQDMAATQVQDAAQQRQAQVALQGKHQEMMAFISDLVQRDHEAKTSSMDASIRA